MLATRGRPAPPTFTHLSFDCYGTLVDWKRGLTAAIRDAVSGLPEDAVERLLAERGRAEWRILERMTVFAPYREVLGASFAEAARALDLAVDAAEVEAVAASVGRWPPFPEVPASLERLATRFRLAIASNVDRADLRESLLALGLRPDDVHCVTAEDVGCYKPEPDHLMALVHELGIDEPELLHASAYPAYDLETARDLGIPCAYVDRLGRPLPPDLDVVLTVRDLAELDRRLDAR